MTGLIYATEPPFPMKRLGKCVPYEGNLCYVFDGVSIYRRLQALGVAETVLIFMLSNNVREVHFTIDGQTYIADRDTVIEYGEDDSMRIRCGYRYLALKRWRIVPGKLAYPWTNAEIRLPWVVDTEPLAMWRRKLIAARPPEPARPVQMGLWA